MKQRILALRDAWEEGTKRLGGAGIDEARLDAWYLLEWAAKISREAYYLDPLQKLGEKEAERYRQAIERRASRIPLQHITGEQEFMGLKFLVDGNVLIPRQDTEILVETVLNGMSTGMRVLDMCTGSGCIAVSLAKLGKKSGRVNGKNRFAAADVSCEALKVARENARMHGVDVEFFLSDLFESVEGRFDCIVSNPPYIRTREIEKLQEEVRLHDPRAALDGGEDGLYFYRRIVRDAAFHLEDGGLLAFETGCDQSAAVAGLMEEAGYARIETKRDLAGLDRVVTGRLAVRKTWEPDIGRKKDV